MPLDVIESTTFPGPKTPHGGVPGRPPGLWSTIRYVFAHGWVWLCLVSVLCTYVAVMLTRGAPWRGDAIWTVDWLPIGFVLAGPLISGFVAMDTARLGIGVRDLPLARGRDHDTAVAATYGLALTALHLLFTTGTLIVSRPPIIGGGVLLAVLVQVMILLFFVALGSLIGRYAPPVLGGVGAALAAVAAVYLFSAPRSPVGLLYAGAATTPRIGYAYDALWLTVQALALGVVIAATWAVRPGRARSWARVVVTGVVAVALAIGAGAAVWAMPGDRLEANGAQPDACGALASVPWCYYPQHERVVGFYADELLALFEAATSKGYDGLVPDRILEADQKSWPSDETTGAFYVTPEALAGQRPTLWEVTTRLVEPVHCTQLAGDVPPSEAYWNDLSALTATWAGLVDPNSPIEQFGYTGDPLSPADAERIMTEFRTCTYRFR